MILSDRDIRLKVESGEIGVTSPENDHMQHIHASSMDFRLGHFFKIYDHVSQAILDPMDPESLLNCTKLIEIPAGKAFIVQPHEFVLGVTMETVKLPDDLVARVEGRSSLGRLGIIVHSTAGYVDPGFEGTITLEITNINRMPVALYPGMRVCQLAFQTMTSIADFPYHRKPNSKYQGQKLPEESRISRDPEFEKLRTLMSQ